MRGRQSCDLNPGLCSLNTPGSISVGVVINLAVIVPVIRTWALQLQWLLIVPKEYILSG